VGNFIWMFQVELSDGAMLQVYKHIDTRRYIHLSSNGQAFAYEPPSHYRSVPAMRVLAEVFATLPGLAGVTAEQIQPRDGPSSAWASTYEVRDPESDGRRHDNLCGHNGHKNGY
jgi:hypothetical protein